VAGGAAGIELLPTDAGVLVGLADGALGRVERREPLLGLPLRRADEGLELAQRPLDLDPIPLHRGPRFRDLRLAPGVRTQIPREPHEARPDLLGPDNVRGGVVNRSARRDARTTAPLH